ncbi:MAG: class I SAM-dependent methyltransferase [Candidatus Aenigmarchaeota archaeon]|nr:class I SAM-dependent methyltransferase [Candidatus Aenigmarchaeota archaeon]
MTNVCKCRLCGEESLKEFITLGMMPIANAFLKKENIENDEYKFELNVGFCENCKMVQLIDTVDKTMMFNDNYAYFSSVSKTMEDHFKKYSDLLTERFLEDGDLVIEIGCNDGIMLKNFDRGKFNVFGVEPSDNVAEAARNRGLNVITNFFDQKLAEKIVNEKGKAKVIYAANVMCHIEAFHEVVKGVKVLLKDKGVLVFEDPYIIDIIEKNAYDQIYDEHVFYFSLTSLKNFFSQYGMTIFDCERQTTHGGSMRYYVCNDGDYEIKNSVSVAMKNESEKKIYKFPTYENFAENVKKSKKMLVELLNKVKSEGRRITGYAASSKGTIVLNYCGITAKDLEYISDNTPTKIGLYSPGMHIPIVSEKEFHENPPDYAILLAWNYAKEIKEKEKESGVKFIVHIPFARVI